MVNRMPQTKRILLLLIFALIFHQGIYAHQGSLARRLISQAQAEVGNGEQGSNNMGPSVRLYLRGKEGMPWCAGFISYILSKENITDLGYSLSAREIYNKAKELGWLVRATGLLKPGDLIIFWRVSPTDWRGHIGIIEKIDETYIHTIEGNVGKYPAKVRRFKYDRNNIPKLLGFIRVGGE